MASSAYNSLDDVPLCLRRTYTVKVQYYNHYTDVPMCLQNLIPSFQVQAMTPRSRRQNMPEYLQSTPISQYTREHIAVLHQWADCPASQLLTDDGLAFCLRQYDVTSDMVVQWGIYYYLNQNPCSDPRWCTLQAEQLLNQVRERSMLTMLCYFRGILATTAREDYFEMLYTLLRDNIMVTKRYGPPDHERSLALDVHGGYGFYKSCCLDPLGFTLLTSRRLSSHSPASARQRLASRDLPVCRCQGAL